MTGICRWCKIAAVAATAAIVRRWKSVANLEPVAGRSRRDCGNREAGADGRGSTSWAKAAVAATAAIVRRSFILVFLGCRKSAAVAATAAIVRRLTYQFLRAITARSRSRRDCGNREAVVVALGCAGQPIPPQSPRLRQS